MRISLSAGAQVLTSLNTLTRYKTCPTVQLPYQHSRLYTIVALIILWGELLLSTPGLL